MTTVNIRDRVPRGSAKRALLQIHAEPKWAFVEVILNAMTAMRNSTAKWMHIQLDVGNNHDAWAEDSGTGITNYEYLEGNMGCDIDEQYAKDQNDPEYLNKMGIGMNSIADLSKDGLLEYHSVYVNKYGQTCGLIARYQTDVTKGSYGFVIPAEHPDSKYVLNRPETAIQTGVRLIIKNAKQVQTKRLIEFLEDIFALKLSSLKDQGYRILISNANDDYSYELKAPKGFSAKDHKIIGDIQGYPVYANLQSVEKKDDVKVKILVKKIKLGVYDSKYMMKGYVGCDILDIKPDREGIRVDEYNTTYQAFIEILEKYAKKNGFKLIPQQKETGIKNEKKWIEKAQEMFLKYYRQNPTDTLLQVDSIKQPSDLTGEPTKPNKIKRPHTHETCPKGKHWDATLKTCVDTIVDPDHIKITRKPPKPRTGTDKNPKLSDDELESIPRLKFGRHGWGKEKWCMVFDESESKIWFNTSHGWTNDKLVNASDETKELVVMMAIMIAVPDNRDMSIESFHRKLSSTLDGN